MTSGIGAKARWTLANVLITGGSGYFGSVLRDRLRACGETVRVFDMVDTLDRPHDVEFVRGDIRDPVALLYKALRDIEVVYHCAAMVPLARETQALWSVNVDGTAIVTSAAKACNVRKFVHLSSSAVYGVPESNPVIGLTQPHPMDPYGASKLAAEQCVIDSGLDATIIRPRTILGAGRLGIFSLLFKWVSEGHRIPVIANGDNVYQFVHANDLAEACWRASKRPGFAIYNIGTDRFGTMRQILETLCQHARTGSTVVSVPRPLALAAMRLCGARTYHRLMYGKSMWFDISRAVRELNWQPRYSNDEMICEAYDWYMAHRDEPAGASAHRAGVRLRWCR